jgi:hypothetical protein
MPLIERRLKLTELVLRSDVHCLHPVQMFDDGAELLEAAERHGLEGIVSKRQASPYRSGLSRDWVKTKPTTWRAANRERWRLFEKRERGEGAARSNARRAAPDNREVVCRATPTAMWQRWNGHLALGDN